jgi:hypothetical protein
MTAGPLDLLRRVVEGCEEVGVGYAIIGAVARNAWAPPRATTDIDVAVIAVAESYGPLLTALEKRGLVLRRTVSTEPGSTVPDIALFEGPPGPVRRADLLIAKTPFEREAVEQSVTQNIGVACQVVRPEYLVVYKLIAGRPRDLDDASEVIRTRALAGEALDLDLVRRWADEWGVEERLDQLLESQDL